MIKINYSREKPPVYEQCEKQFGVSWNRGIIFTYGDTIHCKYKISPQKIAHEKAHVYQQVSYGVEAWWKRYLEDNNFRLSQEVEAYKAEIEWIKEVIRNYPERMALINGIILDLSSSMYGNIINYEEAKALLR